MKKYKVRYTKKKYRANFAGSLIQQNYGEDLEKGFLMWDIRSAKDFDVDFVKVHNDYAYATIYADDGILPNVDLPSKTRIRVIWSMKSSEISRAEASRLNSLIRQKYNPLSVQITFKPIQDDRKVGVDLSTNSNLADPIVQRDLLRQWLMTVDGDVDIDKVIDIDKSITDVVTNSEFEDFSNSQWALKSITMENFMSYGNTTKFDFDSMRGVIGLFGDNTAGKSVIIDAILYALFNKTTRNVKNEDLVNKYTNSDVCRVRLALEIKGIEYEIERWTTRQYKKRSGDFVNARTDVTLKRRYNENDEWENLTETQRKETEKIIRNAMGEFDDFLLTTLSTQNSGNEFLNLRPALRSDSMLRYLGLDVFNKKFDYAKDLLKQIENERRFLDSKNSVEMLDTKIKSRDSWKRKETDCEKRFKEVKRESEKIRGDILKHQSLINRTISIDRDVDSLEDEIFNIESTIEELTNNRGDLTGKINDLTAKMKDIEKSYTLDEEKLLELSTLRDKCDGIKNKIKENENEIESNKRVLRIYKGDLEKENNCPVVDDERHVTCVFLKGFIDKKKECVNIINTVNSLMRENDELKKNLSKYDYVYSSLKEQETIRSHMEKAVIKLESYRKELVGIDNKLEVKSVSLNLAKSQHKIAKANEETIRQNREHKKAIVDLEGSLQKQLKLEDSISENKATCTQNIIILEREITDIEETLDKIRNSDEQHKLYNVYCNAMHRNGLPVNILRDYLPKINYEINKILSDVVNFGVYLKIDEGETDIDIVMRYDGEVDDTRPAQMSSGMEKLLINFAIRYALLSVSNITTPSTWFIDEGFGTLDAENRSAISQFFVNVKSVFRNIVIITHIDELKDVGDHIINIEKKDGISSINVLC